MDKKIITKNEIKTSRLSLMPLTCHDKERLFYLLNNKEITKTFMVPDFDEEKMYELIDKLIEFSKKEDELHLVYGIYLESYLIGILNDCGFDNENIEIGYFIDPIYQGKGYATESFNAVIYEVKEMGFKKVLASHFENNIASRKVMEKCGLKLNGDCEVLSYRGKEYKCIYLEKILN